MIRARSPRWLLVPAALASLAGCAPASELATPGARHEAIVYGTDDRQDVYAHPSATLRALAQDSIVALMRPSRLVQQPDQSFELAPTFTLGEAHDLCSDQRFLDQPTSAFCSGTLISDDVVVTAGHCVEDMSDCVNTRFVFDYLYSAEGELARIDADDVYSCATILSREDGALDYAYLQLDRAVVGHAPATLAPGLGSTCRSVVDDQPVSALGFGSGLPLKIDAGGAVTSPSSRGGLFFLTSLDTFAGNSGSGVFDASARLVGVLSSGLGDYGLRDGDTCYEVNTLPERFGGEQIGHLFPTLLRYCEDASDPDAAVCALAASACPDGPSPDAGVPVDAGTDPDAGVDPDGGELGADLGPTRSSRGCSVSHARPSEGHPLGTPTGVAACLLLGALLRRRARRGRPHPP